MAAVDSNNSAPRVYLASDSPQGQAAGTASFVASMFAPALLAGMCCALSASSLSITALCAMTVTSVAVACAGGAASMVLEHRRWLTLVSIGGCAAALALMLAVPALRVGLYAYWNSIVWRVDDALGLFYELVAPGDTVAGDVGFGVCLGVLAGASWWEFTRLRSSAPALVIIALFCGCGLYLNMGAGFLATALGIGGWLVLCRFTQLRDARTSWMELLANMAVAVAVCVAIALCGGVLYTPSGAVEQMRSGIVAAFDSFRFGPRVLPEGNLAAAAAMNKPSSETLELNVSGQSSDDILLRGYVGASFADGAWSPIDHTAFQGDWNGMASWLGSRGFAPERQRSLYDDLQAQELDRKTSTLDVSVDASGTTSRYTFVPYSLRALDGSSTTVSADGSLVCALWGNMRYGYSMDNVAADAVFDDASWLASADGDFAASGRVYGAFAQTSYTEVPKAERSAIKKLIFDDATWDASADVSDYAVISRVRTMLGTLASYTDRPSVPRGKDSFADWFLSEARAGNSAYFATVATLALRTQGIPARYVEGYRAARSDIARAVADKSTLTLGSDDLHAWCEVYLDGLGWTPVEVTPGFYSQTVQADSVIDVNEVRGGSDSGSTQVGSVMGDIEGGADFDKKVAGGLSSPMTVLFYAICIVLILLIVVLCMVAQRAVRIRRSIARANSEDQSVCVPELYRYLTRIMCASGIGFDPTRPLEVLDRFEDVFSGVDAKEYRRVIELHQAYAFGGRTVMPNELRAVRRITARMHKALPEPTGVIERIRRYAIDIL